MALVSRVGSPNSVNCFNILWKANQKRLYAKVAFLLNEKPIGNRATVQGWIKSKRKMKVANFIDVSDGSTPEVLQVIIPDDLKVKLDVGASVKIDGIIKELPNKSQIELFAENVQVLGPCVSEEGYPFIHKRAHSFEHLRQHIHFRPRTNIFSSILRVRSNASKAVRDHFADEGFFEINTPVLTSSDCEGAGEVFSATPHCQKLIKKMTAKEGIRKEEAFFGTEAFLTVSGQLHLEATARALGNVYTFGPTFRAENSKSRLHLSEFYMIEAEMVLQDNNIKYITASIENMLRNVTKRVLDDNFADINAISKGQKAQQKGNENVVEYPVDPVDPENIRNVFLSEAPYTVMTFKQAFEILSTSKTPFKVRPAVQDGFTKEHELYLVKYNGNKPLFIIEWPRDLKAFYMKGMGDGKTVAALDLLVPVVGELCGGSVREDSFNDLKTKADKLGIGKKLEWYLDLRRFGNVSTGGYGMGFERYLQCLLNIPNIKDVIPFPRWPHSCQM